MTTYLIVTLIVLLAGAAIKMFLDVSRNELCITRNEFIVGAVVICALIVPLTSVAGTKIAKGHAIGGFKEFWGGYEAKAYTSIDECRKTYDDGGAGDGCVHDYRCDPVHHVHTRTVTDTDSKGNTRTRTETYSETHWHYCPETTHEISYLVDTTLGTEVIAGNLLPPDPYRYEWDRDGNIPSQLVAEAKVPEFWTAAKQRIASGDPGPVTEVHDYENFILASQRTTLKRYSGSMEIYLGKGLLPKVTMGTRWPYLGDKAYFVGKRPANADALRDSVDRFNAAFGADLQGDLHLLVVTDKRITNPDEWFSSLMAYWQSKKLGKNAISKNALVVAIGTDGKTVTWARAATGMPVGNEGLATDVRYALEDKPLDPDTLIGLPKGVVTPEKGDPGDWDVKVTNGGGALEKAVWGPNKFHRICMKCDDAEDEGVGFGYLSGEIQPSGKAKFFIGLVAFFLSMIVWGVFVAVGVNPNGVAYDSLHSGRRPGRRYD